MGIRANIVAKKCAGGYRMRIGAEYPRGKRIYATKASVIKDALAMYATEGNIWGLQKSPRGVWSIELDDDRLC